MFSTDLETGLEDNLNHQVTSVSSPKICPGLIQEVHTTKRGRFNSIIKQKHFFSLVLLKDNFAYIIVVMSFYFKDSNSSESFFWDRLRS